MSYEAVIGIEIHCELKTHSKMFSPAPVNYGAKPNSLVHPIDLALPGTLPSVNKQAVQFGVNLCKALNLEIDPLLKFDRKNYYYSDLPKGYQITQQFYPLGQNGHFDILVGEEKKTIRINRLHLEEDTAKQFHEGEITLIDFNRAGTPLLEIVTEADFRTGQEAAAYVEGLRQVVTQMGISDGKMAEGSYRCDVNISIRPVGQEAFGTKVEIKNLNSTSNVQKSIEYEIERQKSVIESGDLVVQETRRFDEKSQSTISMRLKETLVDYRYFRDPNIPNIEAINKKVKAPKLITNWLTQDLQTHTDKKGNQKYSEWIDVNHFAKFIEVLDQDVISSKQAKEVFESLLENKDPMVIIEEKGMKQISDPVQIEAWVKSVLDENPQAINDYKNGLKKSLGFVVGQVMKLSGGQVNPKLARETVVSMLDKAA